MTDPAGRPHPPGHPGQPPTYPGYPPVYPGYQQFGGYPQPMRNGLGTAALVTAVIALVTAWSVAGGVLLGGVAVLLGLLGYGRVRRGTADNRGIAIAGVVLGGLAIVAGIACAVLYATLWRSSGAEDYVDCMTSAGSDAAAQQACMDRFRTHFEDRFGNDPLPRAP